MQRLGVPGPKFPGCSEASTLPMVMATTVDTLEVSEAGGIQPQRTTADGTQARWQAIAMKPPLNKSWSSAGGLAGVAVAIVAVAGALCGPPLLVSTPAARRDTKIESHCSIRLQPNARRAEVIARCGLPHSPQLLLSSPLKLLSVLPTDDASPC